MTMTFDDRARRLFVAGILVLAAAVLVVKLAQAHGEDGTVQLVGQTVAGHDVTVVTAPRPPRAGSLHLAVQLIDPRKLTYVETATVTATARHLGEEAVRVSSTRSRYRKPWHELDLSLKPSGRWRVRLFIDGPNGQGDISFKIRILPERD